jgi:hypothetical protein
MASTTTTTLEVPTGQELRGALTAILDLEEYHIRPIVDLLTAFLRHDEELDREQLSELGFMKIAGFLAEGREQLRDMEYALDQLLGHLDMFRDIVADGLDDPATIGRYGELARKRRGNA